MTLEIPFYVRYRIQQKERTYITIACYHTKIEFSIEKVDGRYLEEVYEAASEKDKQIILEKLNILENV